MFFKGSKYLHLSNLSVFFCGPNGRQAEPIFFQNSAQLHFLNLVIYCCRPHERKVESTFFKNSTQLHFSNLATYRSGPHGRKAYPIIFLKHGTAPFLKPSYQSLWTSWTEGGANTFYKLEKPPLLKLKNQSIWALVDEMRSLKFLNMRPNSISRTQPSIAVDLMDVRRVNSFQLLDLAPFLEPSNLFLWTS